jgi:alpha-tubulin suppressor-like RCC1 family protein
MPNGGCAYADSDCGDRGLRYSADEADVAGACVAAASGADCITQMSAGIAFSCALKSDGSVWCWGADDVGQLGDGQPPGQSRYQAARVALPGDLKATYVGCGETNACALAENGTVWCWGGNDSLQLGLGEADAANHSTPAQLNIPSTSLPITNLSVGAAHACAVDSASAVWCWGENDHDDAGQDANTPCPGTSGSSDSDRCEDVPQPTLISAANFTASSVVMGDEFSCAVDDLNEAHCWGDNTLGELGIGTLMLSGRADYNTPAPQKSGMGSFLTLDNRGDGASLAAGAEHACAAAGGSVFCWGSNGSGQVGIGTKTAAEPTPRNVMSSRTVVSGCMSKHTCVLDSQSGALTCWGNNADGEIGIGSLAEALNPTRVPIAGVRALALGETHSCALLTGGAVYCWGSNEQGQLGFASPSVVASPRPSGVAEEICH